MRWLFYFLVSIWALTGLADYPLVATMVASVIMGHYCVRTLALPAARFIYLYPLFCFWLSQQFTVYSFFEIGDGPAYFAVMNDMLPRLASHDYPALLGMLIVIGPKYLNLGFLPTAVLPDLLFERPDAVHYQLMQVYVHLTLVSLLLALTTNWNVIGTRYRVPVFLFMLLSPGYLALVSYPTRHHVTSFGVFLLFISLEACFQHRTPVRVLTLLAATVLVFFCKAGLVPFFMLYIVFRLHRAGRVLLNLLLAALLMGIGIYVVQYIQPLYDARFTTETIGVFKNASLGPLIPLYKYVMAIVSPFPYYKYGVVVNTVAYGGNWWLLLLFMPAGAIGLWMFYRMLLNPVKLWRYDEDTQRLFAYGGIMSLSILGGSTGFLMYILICMPFFAPLFLIQEYGVRVRVVLLTLLLLNLAVLVLNGDNVFDYI